MGLFATSLRWENALAAVQYRGISNTTIQTAPRELPAPYRGTSLIRNRLLLGPYSSPVPRGLGRS